MSEFRPTAEKFIQELEEIILKNLDNSKFSVNTLCKEIGLSRSQLHRKVKSATGTSISLFIRKVRLNKAAELLENTNLNISEIAYDTGINSPQNFSKYFFQEYTLSPTEYRKRHRAKTFSTVLKGEQVQKEMSPASNTVKQYRSTTFKAVLGILIVAILGLMIYSTIPQKLQNNSQSLEDTLPSLAVIPFKTIGEDTSRIYLAEGLVEDILTQLTGLENLKIFSMTSTEKYKDAPLSIPEISDILGATYLMDGSIQHVGDQVRISVQLIEGESDKNLWARNFDRKLSNILDIQSEISLEIAKSLNQEISPQLAESIQTLPTSDEKAYRAVLRGRHLLKNRVREEIEEAILLFESATEMDADYAEAYTGLSEAYQLLSNSYGGGEAYSINNKKAEEYALIAIKKKKNNGKAYAILGNVYRGQSRHQEAQTAYENALQLNPKDALSHYWFALQLRITGQLSQALIHHQKAADLDPLHPVISAGYIYTASMAHKFELSDRLIQEDTLVFKNHFLLSFAMGVNLMYQEQYEEAIYHLKRTMELNPGYVAPKIPLMISKFKMGNQAHFEDYLSNLDENDPEACSTKAYLLLSVNRLEEGLIYLEKAVKADIFLPDFLGDPFLRQHQWHPKIKKFLAKFNLIQYVDLQD